MADEELEVTFTLENEPLNAEYELNPNEEIDADFLINASGTTWGSISGDINNQTDLINALNNKANITDIESITGALNDSIIAVDNKYDTITGALDDKIDSINGALGDDIDALESITSGLSDSISAIDSTIGGYGDIVNYNAADFATSIQGGKADTALQPNDNISELYNDAGYITSASLPTVNDGQLKIQVNGTDLATFTANQGTDTIANISIPNAAEWGNITGTLSDQTDLQNALDAKVTNNATGTNALAIGNTSQSTAEGGVAVGYGARANSTYATAVGEEARANNTNTTVIGKAAKATEARAIAIGSGAEANAQDAIAIKGINNTANTFQVYTYNMLDMSTGLIPDARISTNIARTSDMQTADNGLQSQIDAIVASSDVFDIVGTYAELQAYDISTVPVNDIIKVLVDSTHNDAATYYRCTETGGVKSWTYIGAEGAYYTKSESDNRFVPLTRTVNGYALSNNITLTASDVGALADNTVIPTVNNSSIDFQINGTSFDTITLNQSSNDTINISVPTDTNDLTNGAGYITASSIPTDYYTKSEIDAILPQPTKVPIVYYQPTDSYCYTESNNRFYGSHVFEKLYLVQPKTSGTTQVIDMSTTFSLDFSFKYLGAPSSTFTLAEIMVSSASGKGVLLQVNSGGMYYRNNITSSTVTGTRSLVVGNTYDVRVEYNGTKMVISWKLSTDANYTEINATTCTVSGTYYNYASIGSDGDSIYLPLSSVVLVNDGTTLYDYVAGKIALDYDETLTLDSNQLSVVVDQTYDGTSANPQSGVAIEGELSTNYVTTNTDQNITGVKTFVGNKLLKFKGVNGSSKLGFTAFDSSNREVGYLEAQGQGNASHKCRLGIYDTNTSNYDNVLGFEYYKGKGSDGSLHRYSLLCPPLYPSTTDANFYIPMAITDGNTTVTADNTGTVNISSLIPTVPTNISAFTNDSGYITSSALSPYALSSSLATVATSGDYDDLLNKPTIPTALSDLTVSAGSNITISGDTISATDTTYSDFTGADSITAGANGLVPAPSAGDEDKILTGGATWNELKTVNSTSLLGNGNIDTKDIFVAEYDVTTFTDIYTAYTNGKMIFCKENDRIYPLQAFRNNSCLFVGEDENGWAFRRLMVDNLNEWYAETNYFARSDLGNVTNILAESVVADKDLSNLSATGEAKFVNKSGDTMTGLLQINTDDNASVAFKINNVSDTQRDITFNATNHRVATIRSVVNSSNQCQLLLGVNNTSDDFPTGIRIVRDTSGTAYIDQFPQCNAVDGQWVAITQDLISTSTSVNGSSALGAYTISNIPNDGNSYEVLLTGTLRIPTGNNYARLAVYSSKITSSIFICQWQNKTSGNVDISASCIIPVTSNRNIWVVRNTNWNGTVQLLRAVGYRRIGTNT